MHRLRRVRPGLSGRRYLREHRRDARPPEGSDRGQRHLPERGARYDRQGRRDRQAARRRSRGHHGGAGGGAAGRARAILKIATWNVNGIRARHAQVQEWIARDRPDVVCLQEIKATPEQVPAGLFGLDGYWCYWHGEKAYSGVGLHVSKSFAPERPAFSHPEFNFEKRIAAVDLGDLTVASVYVPNGGKDYQ